MMKQLSTCLTFWSLKDLIIPVIANLLKFIGEAHDLLRINQQCGYEAVLPKLRL